MKIKRDGIGWYKISTGRNFGEARARKYVLHELNQKRVLRSLVASGENWESAKHILEKIKEAARSPYGLYATQGAICICGH